MNNLIQQLHQQQLKTAQDAVDAAKKTGVDEVTAVNPEAVKKPAAKKAIDDALKAKEAAIDARPDLLMPRRKPLKMQLKMPLIKLKKQSMQHQQMQQ